MERGATWRVLTPRLPENYVTRVESPLRCRTWLGGLLKYYDREAAWNLLPW